MGEGRRSSSSGYSDPFDPTTGCSSAATALEAGQVGTSGVGCSHPRAPKSVRKDLKLKCG